MGLRRQESPVPLTPPQGGPLGAEHPAPAAPSPVTFKMTRSLGSLCPAEIPGQTLSPTCCTECCAETSL